jgi:hypothetical protein
MSDANEEGFKVNGTHQLLVYTGVDILGGSILSVKENGESLVVSCTETGLEVSADRTKCMVMSRDQNVGQNSYTKIANKSFETVKQFKYLGTTLRNQNSICEEIKLRVKLGNACYHSAQNIFCLSVYFPRNIKVKIYRTVILPIVLYGCETWSLTLREE